MCSSVVFPALSRPKNSSLACLLSRPSDDRTSQTRCRSLRVSVNVFGRSWFDSPGGCQRGAGCPARGPSLGPRQEKDRDYLHQLTIHMVVCFLILSKGRQAVGVGRRSPLAGPSRVRDDEARVSVEVDVTKAQRLQKSLSIGRGGVEEMGIVDAERCSSGTLGCCSNHPKSWQELASEAHWPPAAWTGLAPEWIGKVASEWTSARGASA